MAVLQIRVLGDPVLRVDTTPVTEITSEVRQLVGDMLETMHAANGIGLAAPQVGRTERIAVMDIHGEEFVLINPEIVEREGRLNWEEGCLSIPELYGNVVRAAKVSVQALDREGKPITLEGEELMGVCMQHEIDHLHGKLFIDHLSFLKRQKALRQWDDEKDKYPDFIRIVVPGEHEPEDDRAHDDERL